MKSVIAAVTLLLSVNVAADVDAGDTSRYCVLRLAEGYIEISRLMCIVISW